MNVHDIELPSNPITPMFAVLIDMVGGAGTAEAIWRLMQDFAKRGIEADRKRRHLKERAQLDAEWFSLRQMKEAYEADRKRRDDLEAQLEKALTERDDYHDMADRLAEQIAAITDQEIGEHSSGNNPWQNAMLAADEWIAKDIRRLTDGVDRRSGGEPDAVAACHAVRPYIDSIVCYASTLDEHDGNRVAKMVEDVCASHPQPAEPTRDGLPRHVAQTLDQLPKLEVPLFRSGAVYICRTVEQWTQAHEALGAEPKMMGRAGAANTFRHLSGGQDVYLLGIFDGRSSTLAHEAAHIVFDICHSVGVEVEGGKANEPFCYLLDAIVGFADQILNEPTGVAQVPAVSGCCQAFALCAPNHVLADAIYKAAQKMGIANGDHSTLSVPQCLHLLDCMSQPADPVAYLDLGVGGYMDVGTDLTDEQLAALPKGRHMLGIIGTYGVDGYTPAEPVTHQGYQPIQSGSLPPPPAPKATQPTAPDEERLAMEAVMESVDPATWPGLTPAQRCALGRFAKPQPAESVEVPVIEPSDLRIETYRTEPYSAWVVRPDIGVRVTHVPTGLSAACHEDRSVHRNRVLAMEKLQKMLQAHEPVKLCDCERGHNGMGMTGRICDCHAEPDEERLTVNESDRHAAEDEGNELQ